MLIKNKIKNIEAQIGKPRRKFTGSYKKVYSSESQYSYTIPTTWISYSEIDRCCYG